MLIVLRLAVTSHEPSPVETSTHRQRRRAARAVSCAVVIGPRYTHPDGTPDVSSARRVQMNWVARDAAVVWHGFTQMAAYPDNQPVIVERGEGRELIDVDGRRYFDAISSLWVNTLGHHVAELDRALHDQIDRIAHSTMLGNGNRVVIEFAEALAAVVPVDGAHILFASDGASAVEQALKIAFQYCSNRGEHKRHKYLAFEDGYHGDTVGALSVGDRGFGTFIF